MSVLFFRPEVLGVHNVCVFASILICFWVWRFGWLVGWLVTSRLVRLVRLVRLGPWFLLQSAGRRPIRSGVGWSDGLMTELGRGAGENASRHRALW